ncbi:hypothetical protein DESPIG_00129 [Desulfovibrio piger ATCC 29098]|uniref:Uncharacterized protein n=1 Tax=Desulfovibrio piger ATCC 29098 TaxID=411464 RepID=B6WQ06_9BACT|nr:hypothetical protein DESPIG_00129 [Desulfovibrio piger ATCC 29098]
MTKFVREGGAGLKATDASLAEFSARSHALYDYLREPYIYIN